MWSFFITWNFYLLYPYCNKAIIPRKREMKPVFIFIFIMLSFSTAGQNCDYLKNETDPQTKEVIKITAPQTISNRHNRERTEAIHFALKSIDDSRFLKTRYQGRHLTPISPNYCFSEGCAVEILLKSGDIITLDYFDKDKCAEAKTNTSQYGSYTNYTITGDFFIPEDKFKLLSTHQIYKISIIFSYFYTETIISRSAQKPLGGFDTLGDENFNPQDYFIKTLQCIK